MVNPNHRDHQNKLYSMHRASNCEHVCLCFIGFNLVHHVAPCFTCSGNFLSRNKETEEDGGRDGGRKIGRDRGK